MIDLDPDRPDRARGSVYTTAQIKHGERWIRQAICYFDRYAKRDGSWLFISRDHQLFYGADYDQRPNDLPPANWPDPIPAPGRCRSAGLPGLQRRPSSRVRNSSTAPSAALIAAA